MAQLGILLAMRGAAEEALLRQLHNHPSVTVARRCADGAEVLSAALAGVGDAAVIDAHLGVERSFVLRLRKAGVQAIVVAAEHERAAFEDMGAQVLIRDSGDLLAALLVLLEDDGAGVPETAEPVSRQEPEGETGRASALIGVLSGWGSPGRTTLAVNLAAELAARGGSPLLIDADLWGASVKQNLGLDPDGTGLAAALRAVERGTFDSGGLLRLTEERDGIRVLGGLNKSERWREVSGVALESFWDVVRTWPGYVIIDGPVRLPAGDEDVVGSFGPAPNDMWNSIWAAATDVCLVGSADTVGVHRFVNFYLDLEDPPRHIAINRVRASAAGPGARESIRELLARFAGISDPILIPEDEQVDRAVLAAAPLIVAAPRAPARHAVETLSDRFLPQRRRIRNRGLRRRRVDSPREE